MHYENIYCIEVRVMRISISGRENRRGKKKGENIIMIESSSTKLSTASPFTVHLIMRSLDGDCLHTILLSRRL
jgi:hypothetical protein